MRGFSGARLGALVSLFAFIVAGCSGCALFNSTIVKDLEVDCSEPALEAAASVLLPDVLAWAEGTSVNWLAALTSLEAPGEAAVLCAAATGVKDLDPAGATAPAAADAGPVTAATPSSAALTMRSTKPLTKNLVIAANLRSYLAAHGKRPLLSNRR